MKTDEIIETIYRESDLKPDDYFETTFFYYLSGRFPDLTIRQCTEITDRLRKRIAEDENMDW